MAAGGIALFQMKLGDDDQSSDIRPAAEAGVEIVVYGDGACSGNPGPGGWAFLLADLSQDAVVEFCGFEPITTNNRMELMALLKALRHLEENHIKTQKVELFWDSSYVVNGFNQWLHSWASKNFKKADGSEVLNLDLWTSIWELKKKLPKFKMTQIPGHSGLPGNERVDKLSVEESQRNPPAPLQTKLSQYIISTEELLIPLKARSSASHLKYPAYVVYTDKKITRFLTWDECKNFVSGKKNAKYKKVKNSIEETQTLKAWNLSV